jgi:hypothetical protein
MKVERKPDAAAKREPAFDARPDRHEAGGRLTLQGDFFASHRDEVLALVRSREAHYTAQDSAKRILAIESQGDGVLVTTAEPHLAEAIAHALHDAFKGDLHFESRERPLRASWRR